MSFVVKGTTSTFTPAPAGTHSAVCVDVIDLGIQQTSFGEKHRARFVWEIDETNPEFGAPFLVFATMNVSLHENATMGELLRRWRGRDFTAEELEGFDIENVLGAACLLTVEHNTGSDGVTVYANVSSAVPLAKGMAPLEPSGNYVREIDKDESKDVRSKNFRGDTGRTASNREAIEQARAVHQPAGEGEGFASHDDGLPF